MIDHSFLKEKFLKYHDFYGRSIEDLCAEIDISSCCGAEVSYRYESCKDDFKILLGPGYTDYIYMQQITFCGACNVVLHIKKSPTNRLALHAAENEDDGVE